MTLRPVAAIVVATLGAGALSCAAHRPVTPEDRRTFGLYRCTIEAPDGAPPRFRMLLFAETPDRLHAEVLGPMGGPRLVLDAGAGAMSVTDVEAGIAYAGPAEESALHGLLGVRIGLPALVEAIVRGAEPGGALSLERKPARGEGLPDSLRMRDAARSIEIVRLSRRPVRAGAVVGTGTPPAGVQVRPLHELREAGLAWPAEGGRAP